MGTKTRLKILHPPNMDRRLVEAATRGAARLEGYGVQVETAVADRKGVKDVITGVFILDAITHGLDGTPKEQLFVPTVLEALSIAFRSKSRALGLGLSPHALPQEGGNLTIGLQKPRVGSLVSIAAFSTLDESQRVQALELVVSHQLGHLYGATHCDTEGCFMQSHEQRLADIVARLLRSNEYCRRCRDVIANSVERMGELSSLSSLGDGKLREDTELWA